MGVAGLFAVAFLVSPYWYAYKMYREALEDRLPLPPVPPKRNERELQAIADENLSLKADLRKVYDACEQIFHLGGGAQAEARSIVLDEEILVVIDETGAARIKEIVRYQARNPIRYLQQRVFGDAPVPLSGLSFEAKVDGGRKVRVLPTRDEATEKVFLLFFLPEISPDDSFFTCTIEWNWPQMFPKLVNKGEEFWKWTAKGSSPVPRIRFRFKLHPKLPAVRLSNAFDQGRQVDPPNAMDEIGYREFIWEMTDVNPANPIDIRLKPL